jgi:hypothetical protein
VPVLLRTRGYIFKFYARDRPEPPHVHVIGNAGSAKIWLTSVEVVNVRGYSWRRVEEIHRIAKAHRASFEAAWVRFFAS